MSLQGGQLLCLTTDLDLKAGPSSALTRTVVGSDAAWTVDFGSSASSVWTLHYNTTTPTQLASSCSSLFFD